MEKCEDGTITRASLERLGFLGELYDARTESLSSRSLFNSSLPKSAIECRDLKRMEFDYRFTENISDSFELIKIEPELQFGILCGLVNLKGGGKFLIEGKKSEKTVSCSLVCKFETVCEKFYAAWNEILNDVDLIALEDDKNTHVIVECYWGANCLLSMECHCDSESEKKEVKSRLGADMKILGRMFGTEVNFGMEKISENLTCRNDVQIRVYADVLPENTWPATPEDFCKLIQEVPKLLKGLNEGKGKPLKYAMIPLSAIRKLAKVECAIENVVVQISEAFFFNILYFFDEIDIVKRRFYDHLTEMEKYKIYVSREYYQKSKEELANLNLKERTFKQLIADEWASVRSGAMPLKDLMKSLEKSKTQFNLPKYLKFLDSTQEMHAKLSCIKNILSQGIIYLGAGQKFSELLTQDPTSEFITFLTSGETVESELGQKTLNYFLKLKTIIEPGPKFVVIDEDYGTSFFNNRIRPPRCVHLKGLEILSEDLYVQHKLESELNLVRPNEGADVQRITHKPAKRVRLKMTCPNFQENICKPDLLEWNCVRCKGAVEYGFDNFFYCSCGKIPSSSCTFKCSDLKHGNVFVAPKADFLKDMLSNLRSDKRMNILILGQSGVGKSTWVNSVVNYLSYESLEDAETNGVICAIPMSFPVYESATLKNKMAFFGDPSAKENTEAGQSGTLSCHTYSFVWGERVVNLIDTPGLGDTRGIIQDRENIINVMTYIGNLNELHGICILLKATDNRSTHFFSYCFKELLVNLHKNVTRNLVFCFTHTRNAFRTPGQMGVILEKIITDLGISNELPLSRHNMFCLDNESFIFLCFLMDPCNKYQPDLQSNRIDFARSFKQSQAETERLFRTIENFQPCQLRDTMALFKARNRILSFLKPLVQTSKTVQMNFALIAQKREEITDMNLKLEELSKKLTHKEFRIDHSLLERPRTVCTKPACVDYVFYESENITDINYKTHCHDPCYLENVELRTLNNAALKNCSSMLKGLCTLCGCSWSYHMHIREDQKRVLKEITNKKIASNIQDETSARKAVEDFLKDLESRDQKLRHEHNVIVEAIAKLGAFLKKNAIAVYNDSVSAYLDFLIKEQENKRHKLKADFTLLENMKATLEAYEEEVKIWEKVLSDADNEESITAMDIDVLEKKLFELEINGEELKKSIMMNRKAAQNRGKKDCAKCFMANCLMDQSCEIFCSS